MAELPMSDLTFATARNTTHVRHSGSAGRVKPAVLSDFAFSAQLEQGSFHLRTVSVPNTRNISE